MADKSKPKCGVVRPISECDGCSEAHWSEVGVLIERAAEKAGYSSELVSEADDVGVIHKRIVQNLYECPIVVCDISGRNANVMFELGMRLAFDKPTVVIKDDKTPFSFDTSPLEHLSYPRDLRYSKVEPFVQSLSTKIKKCVEGAGKNSFLKSFGSFKVADIAVEKASIDELILDELSNLKREIRQIRNSKGSTTTSPMGRGPSALLGDNNDRKVIFRLPIPYRHTNEEAFEKISSKISELKGVKEIQTDADRVSGDRLVVVFDGDAPLGYIEMQYEKIEQYLSEIQPK